MPFVPVPLPGSWRRDGGSRLALGFLTAARPAWPRRLPRTPRRGRPETCPVPQGFATPVEASSVVPGQAARQHGAGCVWCFPRSALLRAAGSRGPRRGTGPGRFYSVGSAAALFAPSVRPPARPLAVGFWWWIGRFSLLPLQQGCPLPDAPSLSQPLPRLRVFLRSRPGAGPGRARSRAACCGLGGCCGRGGCCGVWGDGVATDGGCGKRLLGPCALAPSDHGLHPLPRRALPGGTAGFGDGRVWGCPSPHGRSLRGAEPWRPQARGSWLLFLLSFAFSAVPREPGWEELSLVSEELVWGHAGAAQG